jgi:hypothetical protein
MILLDVKCDQIIDLLDVRVNSRMVQNELSGNHYQGINHQNVESNVTIFLSIENTDWVRGWMNDIWSSNTGQTRNALDYKRDIFITNKVDMKFTNSYPIEWTLHEDKIELEFTCDYHEIGGNFPELKQIYRDKKIDQILN